MEIEQIIDLMKAVSETGMTEFVYEHDGVTVTLKNEHNPVVVEASSVAVAPQVAVQAMPQSVAVQPEAAKTTEQKEISGKVVKCPLIGTFYEASAPDAQPYVKVGDTVSKGQVLGIVEAMKLMNEIESEFDGVVKEILVKNGELVEYDQPMFVIG